MDSKHAIASTPSLACKNLGVVGADGVEPSTSSLSVKRSTGELRAQILQCRANQLPRRYGRGSDIRRIVGELIARS